MMQRVSSFLVVGLLAGSVGAADAPANPQSAVMCRLLGEALAGKPVLETVKLSIVDTQTPEARSMVLFGTGVGIWNGKRQFKVGHAVVHAELLALEEAGYCSWPEKASEIKPGVPKREIDAVRVNQSIGLSIGDASKLVLQTDRGRQNADFAALADRLLKACQKAGESGVSVSSLAQGVAKLHDGTLAPEALTLSINAHDGGKAAEGWLLAIEGRDVVVQTSRPATGLGERRRGRLSTPEFAAVVKLLVDAGVATLPANLYADGYTDLVVTVLDQRKTVQARAFTGMNAGTDKSAQESLTSLRTALREIYARFAASTGSAAN